jgi:beta-glucosidase
MMKWPKNFVWGTATASYQIEGAVHKDDRADSIWDVFCRRPNAIVNNDSGEIACDHYNRYEEDVTLLSQLGVTAYRFSCAWPRILPNGTGKSNSKGLDFYDRLVDRLLEHNITPWLTLYHWDLPQTLQDKGGWTNRDIVGWFSDYAEIVTDSLGDRISNFMILNEPSVVAFQGHLEGTHAPGLKNLQAYAACAHHQNLVIGTCYRSLKSKNHKWNIGSAYTHFPVRPITNTDKDNQAQRIMDALWTRAFFDPLLKGRYPEILQELFSPLLQPEDLSITQTNLDFVGIQHYAPSYAKHSPDLPLEAGFTAPPAHIKTTDMGWAVEPQAFYETLMDMKQTYGNPKVIVTENGAAYKDTLSVQNKIEDDIRVEHYQAYTTKLNEAIENRCNIEGYFAWSFIDNFEWAWGYDKRFGLVYIDYANQQKRIPKKSFYWYADFISSNMR